MATATTTIDLRSMLQALGAEQRRALLGEFYEKDLLATPGVEEILVIPPYLFPIELPRISCVMPIAQQNRIGQARQAVECFLRQSYPNKELIIVNGIRAESGPTVVTTNSHPLIREERVEPGLSIGAMRNAGLDLVQGEWVVPWDDDDYSSPHRLVYQKHFAQQGRPVLLAWEVRVNLVTSTAFYHHEPHGIAGTIIHPATGHRYLDRSRNEDYWFWYKGWGADRVVVNNHWSIGAGAATRIAFHTGANATPAAAWMNRCNDIETGRCSLMPGDRTYLKSVLSQYGLAMGTEPITKIVEDVSVR